MTHPDAHHQLPRDRVRVQALWKRSRLWVAQAAPALTRLMVAEVSTTRVTTNSRPARRLGPLACIRSRAARVRPSASSCRRHPRPASSGCRSPRVEPARDARDGRRRQLEVRQCRERCRRAGRALGRSLQLLGGRLRGDRERDFSRLFGAPRVGAVAAHALARGCSRCAWSVWCAGRLGGCFGVHHKRCAGVSKPAPRRMGVRASNHADSGNVRTP